MGLETQAAEIRSKPFSLRDTFRMIAALFKLRIVVLLLFAAAGGAFLGAGGVPSVKALITTLVTGILAAGGASAINQYLERSSDGRMRRTQRRPLPAGQIERPGFVLWIAVMMVVVAVVSVLPSNPVMALYLGLGAVIYVGVYTVWLKPRSVLNIVIGGAAGSMAVMTGGAAVGAASDPGVIVLALILFLWTPAHFWSLAMFYKEDYAAADVPMLPVHAAPKNAAWWIFIHAASTGLASLLLAAHPAMGWVYLLPTLAITGVMLVQGVRLIRKPERKYAIRFFILSNIFLALVLGAVMTAAVLNQIVFI